MKYRGGENLAYCYLEMSEERVERAAIFQKIRGSFQLNFFRDFTFMFLFVSKFENF